MAPQPTYDPPHRQLGRLMVEARRRGLSFEEWWAEAVRPRSCGECGAECLLSPCACGCERLVGPALVMSNAGAPPAGAVLWPTDWNDRVTWQAAIAESKCGWQRAYEQARPTRAEEAIRFLADFIGALADAAAEVAGDAEQLVAV